MPRPNRFAEFEPNEREMEVAGATYYNPGQDLPELPAPRAVEQQQRPSVLKRSGGRSDLARALESPIQTNFTYLSWINWPTRLLVLDPHGLKASQMEQAFGQAEALLRREFPGDAFPKRQMLVIHGYIGGTAWRKAAVGRYGEENCRPVLNNPGMTIVDVV